MTDIKPLDITKVLPAPTDTLAALPNVLHQVLNPASLPKQTPLPKSLIGLHKAAVLTFQCWLSRCPALKGILFGPARKDSKPGPQNAVTLVVSTTLGGIWNSDSVKRLLNEFSYVPLGIVIGGELEEEISSDNAFLRKAWCSMMLAYGSQSSSMLVVSFPNSKELYFVLFPNSGEMWILRGANLSNPNYVFFCNIVLIYIYICLQKHIYIYNIIQNI